jgi:hypothetical protein
MISIQTLSSRAFGLSNPLAVNVDLEADRSTTWQSEVGPMQIRRLSWT